MSGRDYDAQIAARIGAGNPHGEADFVESFGGRRVLDGGCGTGRVSIELARRGFEVVGVDLDPEMLATARQKAPQIDWRLGDLAEIHLEQEFDTIVLAGNVMIFLTPGSEAQVLANLARHLVPDGRLIAGFQILPGRLSIERYDRLAVAAGLQPVDRWATWDREPWRSGGSYAV
ncbi:MAG TPA: class I SAM-dependent methyltransferase, partial [Dehalococcoidia bacterium]|nr:class I SAM-dependent methyltransferase [Dehalococcoidia bacterium]